MSISLEKTSADTTVFLVEGEVEFEEYLENLAVFYSNSPTKNLIMDFTNGSQKKFSADQIQQLVNYVKPRAHLRSGGKTATIAPLDIDYGYSRVFQMKSNNFPFEIRIFRTKEEAQQWLGNDSESS